MGKCLKNTQSKKEKKKQTEKTKLSLQLFLMANGSMTIRATDMRVWKGRQFENIQKLDVIWDNDVSGRRFEEWTSIRDWTSIWVYHIYMCVYIIIKISSLNCAGPWEWGVSLIKCPRLLYNETLFVNFWQYSFSISLKIFIKLFSPAFCRGNYAGCNK